MLIEPTTRNLDGAAVRSVAPLTAPTVALSVVVPDVPVTVAKPPGEAIVATVPSVVAQVAAAVTSRVTLSE